MHLELVELYIAQHEKRRQKEELIEKYREECAIKGERLKVRRQQYGLRVSFIAEQIGISTSTLYKLERGIYVRNVKMIERSYELIFRLEEIKNENAKFSSEIQHLRCSLEQGHPIIVQVDGKRYEIPRVSQVQPQERRIRRSVI